MLDLFSDLSNVEIFSPDRAVREPGVLRGRAGIQVCASGHLLIVGTRARVPGAIRPSFERKQIEGFSGRSASRMRKYLRETMSEYGVFITLTYPYGHGFDGERAKRDLAAMLKRMRRYTHSDAVWHDYSSFWFLEFQERGSIHFHIFSTHRFPKELIANWWYEIVGSDDERHRRAGTRIEKIKAGKHGICAYASKYAAKQCQKSVPESFGFVGRFWGVSGRRDTMSAVTWVEAADALGKSVQRQLKRINNLVEEGIFLGKILDKSMDTGDNKVYYVKSLSYMSQLVFAIDHCEHCCSMYRPNILTRSTPWDIEEECFGASNM